MIDGIDRFLLDQTDKAAARRTGHWLDNPSADENRKRLSHLLGIRDPRPGKVEMEWVSSTDRPALVGKSETFEAYAVRWPAFGDVRGEGLLLKPIGREPVADVIAIPDADQTPEMIAGLAAGVAPESQYARRLVESGCRVIVPVLMDRTPRKRVPVGRTTGPEFSNREYLYRTAYELGRHVIGYEVQKVMAAVDWSTRDAKARPVGVIGWGEGGMLALYSASVDTRIDAACVSGYFGRREPLWREPIERNVFGLLERFGDAELSSLVAPRGLVSELSEGPRVTVRSKGAAPGELGGPIVVQVEVISRDGLPSGERRRAASTGHAEQPVAPGSEKALAGLLKSLTQATPVLAPLADPPKALVTPDPEARQARQFHELDRHTQEVLARSAEVRQAFMKRLDPSSPEKLQASAKSYREDLYREVLGRFDDPLLPLNPRTRKVYDTDKYTGYEVVLDVFPEVFACGVLLLPKDLKAGERRPVVVCQHGLEGRPKDTIEGDDPFYHAFAARLAERGFITFSPQNPYVFGERFRALSRKAAPIGKTLWSWIIPQHQQILNFLKSQPNVDPKRIAFYGLSYGGKTAMRVPAVLTDYCLSICSGDFNEWVQKISSNALPFSYLFTHEYEIFEFDLGETFNYAEMAALIAPRPFMVERGHFDGVSTDEWVAFEFAKVRRLYQGQLKLPPDRCRIEFFDGPHTIHGVGTFEFLHKHLNWEKPR
jgi:dienelactone hydrolase